MIFQDVINESLEAAFAAHHESIGAPVDRAAATRLVEQFNRHYVLGPYDWDQLEERPWIKVGRPEMRRLIRRHYDFRDLHDREGVGREGCRLLANVVKFSCYWIGDVRGAA